MKRLKRDPIRFDLIEAFAAFGRDEEISIRDPAAADGFVARARASVERSLSNEALLHGLRTQSMFESLVASLGAVEIIKQEDAGEIYASDERLKLPDFRIVTADGSQMLVEVKNYYQGKDATRAFELDADYLQGLTLYAGAMKCTLLLAIYWAGWNIWTLVRPESFVDRGKSRVIEMFEAFKGNHMASLGDYTIGTRFPLRLVLCADKTKPRALNPDGTGHFTVSNVEIYCGDRLIVKPIEKQIACHLMFWGKWEYDVSPRIVANEIDSVEHSWTPAEDHRQGFEIVETLSGMFSSFYKFATQDEDEIRRLQVDVSPGAWRLIPKEYKGDALPLWLFKLEPSTSDGNPGETQSAPAHSSQKP